jgi:hypothetical protein
MHVPILTRRHFLKLTGCAASALYLPWISRAAVQQELPPVRAVTRGPKFHWRGYYDKLLFDSANRFLLVNQVNFEHRSPSAEDEIGVGMIDLQDNDRWTELGRTKAWNWQQGCMLQWVPGSKTEVIWNDRIEDRFVCHILDVKSGRKRTLPHPFYCLSPDGRWALAPDFRRLNDTRPGYGYSGLPDTNAGKLSPDNSGIWRMDLHTGKRELLISLADAAAIPYPGEFSKGAKHWFNHLLFNTDGSRFLFLHRWRGDKEGAGFATRMFTADLNGKQLHILDPHGRTSHFVWRDPHSVMAWAWHPSHGSRFYLYTDRTDKVEVVGLEEMTVNGHNTFVPGKKNQWVLNDTYPDKQRLQHPYLYHIPTRRKVPLGHFHSPPEYSGEWRCDTHPCADRAGRNVSFDSPHGGNGRQVYVVDISHVVS